MLLLLSQQHSCFSCWKMLCLTLDIWGSRECTCRAGEMHWMTFPWPWPKVIAMELINKILHVCIQSFSHYKTISLTVPLTISSSHAYYLIKLWRDSVRKEVHVWVLGVMNIYKCFCVWLSINMGSMYTNNIFHCLKESFDPPDHRWVSEFMPTQNCLMTISF